VRPSEECFPHFRDFCDTEEEEKEADENEEEDTIADFMGFLKAWRERIVVTIEKQALRLKVDRK
jgi:hypothetical protein